MKYTNEIQIDKPIDEVIALFDNVDNMFKWMEGLLSFDHISGTPGEVGAKSRLKFKNLEMTETITVKNLPHEFSGTYEAKGVFNIVRNRFEALPGNRTKYIAEQEFQFSGFMKVLGALMPGMFKKQSMKHLQSFKRFAESQS